MGVGIVGLLLAGELNMDSALELTRNGVLNNVDVLDGPEDFADLLNHSQRMGLWEVDNLQLRVHAGHHFRVGIDHLPLAEGLLHETSRSVLFLVRIGAHWHEVRVAAQELAGRRDDSCRVLRSANFQVLKKQVNQLDREGVGCTYLAVDLDLLEDEGLGGFLG